MIVKKLAYHLGFKSKFENSKPPSKSISFEKIVNFKILNDDGNLVEDLLQLDIWSDERRLYIANFIRVNNIKSEKYKKLLGNNAFMRSLQFLASVQKDAMSTFTISSTSADFQNFTCRYTPITGKESLANNSEYRSSIQRSHSIYLGSNPNRERINDEISSNTNMENKNDDQKTRSIDSAVVFFFYFLAIKRRFKDTPR